MRQRRTGQIIGLIIGCLVVLVLIIPKLSIKAAGRANEQRQAAISSEQAIQAIRTATTAKPGNVHAMEIEHEADKTICEVAIIAHDGKSYEVEVDIATNTVIEIEEDDNED
ncbi:MAG: PepSY domain-containing protein [Acidobacteriota bacterium]